MAEVREEDQDAYATLPFGSSKWCPEHACSTFDESKKDNGHQTEEDVQV
jgi:hypothetical protein